MTTSRTRIAIVAALIFASISGFAAAKDYQAGSLQIESPWARATPKGAQVGGGYVSITNKGSEPDKLVSGSLAKADHAEIHEMSMDNGIMKMRPVVGGLDIKPGENVTLKPDGYHFMFIGLKEPLKQGEAIEGTLVFEKAGTIPVEFTVEGLAAKAPSSRHEHDSKDGMKGMKGM